MSKKDTEINLGGGNNLNIKSSRPVELFQTLNLITSDNGTLSMSVRIEADFNTVPEEYQEVFLNMLCAKYLNTVSFGDNPFSKCLPAPKRRWWEFWKSKN